MNANPNWQMPRVATAQSSKITRPLLALLGLDPDCVEKFSVTCDGGDDLIHVTVTFVPKEPS